MFSDNPDISRYCIYSFYLLEQVLHHYLLLLALILSDVISLMERFQLYHVSISTFMSVNIVPTLP